MDGAAAMIELSCCLLFVNVTLPFATLSFETPEVRHNGTLARFVGRAKHVFFPRLIISATLHGATCQEALHCLAEDVGDVQGFFYWKMKTRAKQLLHLRLQPRRVREAPLIRRYRDEEGWKSALLHQIDQSVVPSCPVFGCEAVPAHGQPDRHANRCVLLRLER